MKVQATYVKKLPLGCNIWSFKEMVKTMTDELDQLHPEWRDSPTSVELKDNTIVINYMRNADEWDYGCVEVIEPESI